MPTTRPSRRAVVLGLTAACLGSLLPARAATPVTVYKDPNCGCCGGWAAHLRKAGFAVTERPTDDLAGVKAKAGVPDALQSCHTAFVDGFVIEGHVPAEAVQRLLRERPAVAGLAVPGMPVGSPGMEGPNPEPYDVIAFTKEGGRSVFVPVRPNPARNRG
jgi:hypothetical protein